MLVLLKRIWKAWKGLTHNLNAAISWLLMTVTYVVAMGPVAIFFRLTRADLIDRGLGDPRSDTWWHPLPPDDDNVRRVQRPW